MNHMWNFILTYFLFYFLLKNETAQNVQFNNLSQGEHQTSITQVKTRKLSVPTKGPFCFLPITSLSCFQENTITTYYDHVLAFLYCFITHECSLKQYNRFCLCLNFILIELCLCIISWLFLLLNIVFFRFVHITICSLCSLLYNIPFQTLHLLTLLLGMWAILNTITNNAALNFLAYVSHDCVPGFSLYPLGRTAESRVLPALGFARCRQTSFQSGHSPTTSGGIPVAPHVRQHWILAHVVPFPDFSQCPVFSWITLGQSIQVA